MPQEQMYDAPSKSNTLIRRILLGLVIAGFVLRLGAVVAFVGISTPPDQSDDAHEYDTYAWNVAQGRGFRGPSPDVVDQDHLTAYRAPAPSLYYAAIYRVFGHSYAAAHVANSLLGALTALFIFGICARSFSRRAGLFAAGLWTFYPISIYYNLSLQSEVFSTCLLCAFAWSAIRIKDASGFRWSVMTGLLFGVLLLSKPGYVFAAPLLIVWGLVIARGDRRIWLRTATVLTLGVITVAPWAIRNKVVMGSLIPFSTGGGSLLLQANNRIVIEDPLYYGYAIWDTYIPEYAAALRAANDEIKRDAIAKQFGVEWLRENTDKWSYLLRGKLLRMWTPEYYGSRYRVFRPMVFIYYGCALLLFLAVFLPVTRRMLRRGDPGLVIHVMIIATVATTLIFHGQHRYRFPIDPILFCFAGCGMAWIVAAVTNRSMGRRWAESARLAWRKPAFAFSSIAILALAIWTISDNRRIEDYRTSVCMERIAKIQSAARQYVSDNKRAPESVKSLVPAYLPNLQALHCPIHSLDYCDYEFLGSTDPEAGERVISYRLDKNQESPNLVVIAHEPIIRNHRSARRDNHAQLVEIALRRTVLADSAVTSELGKAR